MRYVILVMNKRKFIQFYHRDGETERERDKEEKKERPAFNKQNILKIQCVS